MNRLFFISALIGMTIMASAQKSRVLSVFQMIESEKYGEAKEAIELAVVNDKSSGWARTYYAKGLLCQTAYEKGVEKNDPKMTGLYENQLIEAYTAYEKALELDSRDRLGTLITRQYYALANDFQSLGEKHYKTKEYSDAFTAFEHALLLSKSPLLSVDTDTNLVYNTAMAAFEAEKWGQAIGYLSGLSDDGYSSNSALLLYRAMVCSGDSLQAEEVLEGSLGRYNYDETLVLQLTDRLVLTGRLQRAVEILDTAALYWPQNHHFPWTRGLVFQQMGLHGEATESLLQAIELSPEVTGIYYDLGICYYNRGVEINDSARFITDNLEYQETRNMAIKEFQEAVKWLEKAHDMEPDNQETISRLSQLYYRLQMTDKQKRIEPLLR